MSDRARRARLDAFAHEHAGHTPPGVMLVAEVVCMWPIAR